MTGGGALDLTFIHTPTFEDTSTLTDEELRAVQLTLIENPSAGNVMQDTGGFRKLRAGAGGRGKRGGARVIYLHVPARQTVFLVLCYSKTASENLTAEGKRLLREIAAELKKESTK